MATTLAHKSSEPHFSVSNIISRLCSKKRKEPTPQLPQQQQQQQQQQPESQPQNTRLPLIHAPVPLVLPEHQNALFELGWTTVTFPEASKEPGSLELASAPPLKPHPLETAYQDLFTASQAFFNLPDEQKKQWKHRLGTEEGWSQVPGEKEFITLRTLAYCPDVLRAPAKRYWDLVGQHCSNTLGRVSTALGLPGGEDEGLRQFVGPCAKMPEEDESKTATMLRLFRYEGWEEKVVAEAHADLGLISVVVGDTPGLEVWDGAAWFDVEREVERSGRKGASMLFGRQLVMLANGRLKAGGHRVMSYGKAQTPSSLSGGEAMEKKYRHSIVFVLRAHEPTLVDSDALETPITGKWAQPMKDTTAGALYRMIKSQCFNINIDKEQRDAQKQRLAEGKESGR